MNFFYVKPLLVSLLFVNTVNLCSCLRLNPLENNDKLQSINNQYIAEWQWESWSIKQDLSERDIVSPGPRINAALWKDTNGFYWYLFGGQPVDRGSKIYSDIWKYSVSSRLWERLFPSQEYKGKFAGKIGGMVTLRVNVFDERNASMNVSNSVILCGRSNKRNATKVKKTGWNNFSRRKKENSKTGPEESKSLAVYGPRTLKSNTVWQIDLKDKLWTAYVCCCDTSTNEKTNQSLREGRLEINSNGTVQMDVHPFGSVKPGHADINSKIDKTEDEVENEQEHLLIATAKTKKKKINQVKKKTEFRDENKSAAKSDEIPIALQSNQSRATEKIQDDSNYYNSSKRINISETLKNFSTETVLLSKNASDITTIFKNNGGTSNVREPKHVSKSVDRESRGDEPESRRNATEIVRTPAKLVSKYCPDFTGEGEPISWCDGNNDALIAADLSSPQIVLWFFNLKTSHWSQQSVEIAEDTQWPGCSNSTSIRYAGAGEDVFILCSAPEYGNYSSDNSTWNSTGPFNAISEVDASIKLVYRINSKRLVLESLGKIKLEKFFRFPDHGEMWRNESSAILKVFRISSNETIMLLAYKNSVDLWILMKEDDVHSCQFEPIENMWRGSALKRFGKYYAATYNFNFVSERGASETILTPNPRTIPHGDYWPLERGRFIVRILKNENLKSPAFENQTREHNLTYDLLQSDLKSTAADAPFSHSYSIKVIIFFGISLAIFAVFGVTVFLKKCVNCPSRILMHAECHKSPPIIRYSVIREDLVYPVA